MPQRTANTILVVDDNVGARRSIEALLANEPYRLVFASSGSEALEIARRQPPDLVLLDVMMPGMNGFEVCDAIRSDSRLGEIPIIMITALDDDDSMIHGIEAGADDFLSKPINKIELRSRVKGILRLNRYRKLCDERQKFEIVVEHSKFGYVVLDRTAGVRFANPMARQLLQIPQKEPLPSNIFLHAEQYYRIKPEDIQFSSLNAAELARIDPLLLVRIRSDSEVPMWIRATTIELNGSADDHCLMRLEDISQSMQSFQEKHTFSRMISHKLLTPLNALKAAEQLMGDASRRPSDRDEFQRVVDLQKRGLARLEYDIRSILNFLDSSSDQGPLPPSIPVEHAHSLLQSIADGLPINFELSLPDRSVLNAHVAISSYNMEACLREVFENAIKFHHSGSPAVRATIAYRGESGAVRFEFLNDSTPLDEHELRNAWKPYWQADRYFTGEVRGMGLGLSLIATNVWAAGGTCRIANRKDAAGVQLVLDFPAF